MGIDANGNLVVFALQQHPGAEARAKAIWDLAADKAGGALRAQAAVDYGAGTINDAEWNLVRGLVGQMILETNVDQKADGYGFVSRIFDFRSDGPDMPYAEAYQQTLVEIYTQEGQKERLTQGPKGPVLSQPWLLGRMYAIALDYANDAEGDRSYQKSIHATAKGKAISSAEETALFNLAGLFGKTRTGLGVLAALADQKVSSYLPNGAYADPRTNVTWVILTEQLRRGQTVVPGYNPENPAGYINFAKTMADIEFGRVFDNLMDGAGEWILTGRSPKEQVAFSISRQAQLMDMVADAMKSKD